MRIPKFEVRSQRSIQLAACESVPRMMVITGPNGAGKSTLLNALRPAGGWQNVLYVGPHRSMRRQQVQQRHLLASEISVRQLLMSQNTPGYEGIRLLDGTRDPWSYDDSANYLKHALCQIELERQQAIAQRYDRDGKIEHGTLPDPWEPLRELTHNLLPHLRFAKIDATNRSVVLCLWSVHGSSALVDLDDLSSGEKSIVQMFYPLVERQIRAILADIVNTAAIETPSDIAVLIDEPELHLHPNLQLKVLDYLRVLSSVEGVQVIVATHSPTMVEYASFEELYLLRPVELIERDANQLVRIASDDEKLALLRDVFGNTSNITAMQPIVVVEGSSDTYRGKVVPDRKLYRALHPGFDAVTVVAGGGKAESRSLVRALNSLLPELSSQLRAYALLDRDLEAGSHDPSTKLLPVSMIENLLLDPDSIWEAIQSVIDRTELRSVDDVSGALDELLKELEEKELARRAIGLLGTAFFRPQRPIHEVPQQAEEFAAAIIARFGRSRVEEAIAKATATISALRDSRRRREEFHGKTVLAEFYKRHLHITGLSKVVFTFETARHARRRKAVTEFFDLFFAEIDSGFNAAQAKS
jgi:predicted ATPase